MTLEYLFFANVVLLGRLVLYFRDDAPSRRAWITKGAIELALLAAFFQFSRPVLAAAAAVVIFSLLAMRGERRPGLRNFGRLALGLAELAVLSICFAPAFGAGFRPFFSATDLAGWTTLAAPLRSMGGYPFQLFGFGLLLAANEANLAIRTVFDWLDLKPRKPATADGLVDVDVGELNRGRIIGVLERALLYVFILQGQFGAIGFVLAAKAFTRFKALDDRAFAEYVLIGTLLSAGLALAIGAFVRGF